MTDLGVVIVTYDSSDVIGRCLDSCRALKAVVVDNNSSDDTLRQVRLRTSVQLIANLTNTGFAAAVNQGVEALDTEFILLLNPDVQLQTPIDALLEECRKPGVGLATGCLLSEADSQPAAGTLPTSGVPQTGFTVRRLPTPITLTLEVLGLNRLFPWNPVNRRYRCLDLDLTQPADVEQPPGAFLLFRRDVWKRLGGFDTRFRPVWFEDVDFCKRTLELGVRIRYIPRVFALHEGGNSIAKMAWSCREVHWYVSLLRYASKHFRGFSFRGVSCAVVFGSVVRAIIGVVRSRSREPLSTYAQVIRLACGCAVWGCFPNQAPDERFTGRQ